jgi:hypothetical protein
MNRITPKAAAVVIALSVAGIALGVLMTAALERIVNVL